MGGGAHREWLQRSGVGPVGDRRSAAREARDREVARNRATLIGTALGPIVRGRAAATGLTPGPNVFVIALAFLAIVLPACESARGRES